MAKTKVSDLKPWIFKELGAYIYREPSPFMEGVPCFKPLNPLTDKALKIPLPPDQEDVDDLNKIIESGRAQGDMLYASAGDSLEAIIHASRALMMAGFTSRKKRKCHDCGKQLYFNHYASRNFGIPIEQLEKIWESPYVQLYCCSCYRVEKKIEKLKNNDDRLRKRARRISKELGFEEEFEGVYGGDSL